MRGIYISSIYISGFKNTKKHFTDSKIRTLAHPTFLRVFNPGNKTKVELPLGNYKTVAAFLTLINYANLSGISICKRVKAMSKKIHL